MRWGYIVRGAFLFFSQSHEANCPIPLPHASRFRTPIDDARASRRKHARYRKLSAGNIGVATHHNVADPGLAAASVETLLQEVKRFYVVCPMEVVEHVDNPETFLRSCSKLVKVRFILFFVPFPCLRFPWFSVRCI
jgi:hypothetical protein